MTGEEEPGPTLTRSYLDTSIRLGTARNSQIEAHSIEKLLRWCQPACSLDMC
jgi:hypothetical protein